MVMLTWLFAFFLFFYSYLPGSILDTEMVPSYNVKYARYIRLIAGVEDTFWVRTFHATFDHSVLLSLIVHNIGSI